MIYVIKNKDNNHYLPDRGVFISKSRTDIDFFGFTERLDEANVYYSVKSAKSAIDNACGIYVVDSKQHTLTPEILEIKEVKLSLI